MNIATSTAAPNAVAEDLKDASSKGETAYAVFGKEKLESDKPTKTFYGSMKTVSLKTFGTSTKMPDELC